MFYNIRYIKRALKRKNINLKVRSMPILLEVVFGIIGVAIGGTCYANRKK